MSERQMPDADPDVRLGFLGALARKAPSPPPIWLMRQAGRYLPEYRAVRAKAAGFLELCYTPALAAEVTMQPIRRYGFDAAILFADILVVPDALGQRVRFVEGEGPRLDPVRSECELVRLRAEPAGATFARVLETVQRVRQDLPKETALIGFCGGPWTVATYMVGGQGSADQAEARLWAYRDPAGFGRLIELLVEASIVYLAGQVEAGADALQIFDTWAGSLPEDEFLHWSIEPTRRIVEGVRRRFQKVPIIGFPRGAGGNAADYARRTGIDGLGCDTTVPITMMRELSIGCHCAVQGNLDPLLLVAGGPALEARVRAICAGLAGVPYIFNLGHGIAPDTPPEHVARLVEIVRGSGA
jgi:uroporphyrinogen decarboxylase